MKHTKIIALVVTAALCLGIATLSSCKKWIYDDWTDCPTGVDVYFYNQTPCADDSTYLGDVDDVRVLAFDANGVLAGKAVRKTGKLDKGYFIRMPLPEGVYTLYSWVGIDAHLFDIMPLEIGKTIYREVMLRLKTKVKNHAVGLDGHCLWQGRSESVTVPSAQEKGEIYIPTAVNLLEQTNRIRVEIKLDPSIMGVAKPQDFEVGMAAANGVIRINGDIVRNEPQLTYLVNHHIPNDSMMVAEFTTLKLQTGQKMVLTLKNKKTGEIFYDNRDLIGALLFYTDGGINLMCQHDFVVRFVVKDKCEGCGTYVCASIQIGDWGIHSFDYELR